MSETSRRTFLSGTATAAAAYAVGSSSIVPSSVEARAAGDIDAKVAFDYVEFPRFQDVLLKGTPRVSALMYGLVCADLKGQELLMPSTDGLIKTDSSGMHGVHKHRARLWALTSAVAGGQAPDGKESKPGVELSYWTLDGLALSFSPMVSGRTLTVSSGKLKAKKSNSHPWTNMKWVRSLKAHTGLSLIKSDQRNNPALVASRVALNGGDVCALPPFSDDGQNGEWTVTRRNKKTVTSATTDSMLWQRPLPDGTTSVKVTLTPLGGGTPRELELKLNDVHALLAVITNATTAAHSDPTQLKDSTAFARLLRGGDPAKFTVPVAARDMRAKPAASSEDIHCECASN